MAVHFEVRELSVPLFVHVSLDWFKGKSSPDTMDFPMKLIGVSGFNFPINQSIECEISEDSEVVQDLWRSGYEADTHELPWAHELG
eukprot:s325_g15.t1